MSDGTSIGWVRGHDGRQGMTWNPVTGCTKYSRGCRRCYAKYKAWPRLAAAQGNVYSGRRFEDVRCHPERLALPERLKRPRDIFVNSTSDLFHERVPFAFVSEVLAVARRASWHTYKILTKRSERLLEYCQRASAGEFTSPRDLPNVYLGVSAEDQETLEKRVGDLLRCDCVVRWVSLEPLLAPVTLQGTYEPASPGVQQRRREITLLRSPDGRPLLHWVVLGGESGSGASPMHPEWPYSVAAQCATYGIPLFFKQWGEYVPLDDLDPGARAHTTKKPLVLVGYDGAILPQEGVPLGIGESEATPRAPRFMKRVGKRAAGNRLGSRTIEEFPQAAPLARNSRESRKQNTTTLPGDSCQ